MIYWILSWLLRKTTPPSFTWYLKEKLPRSCGYYGPAKFHLEGDLSVCGSVSVNASRFKDFLFVNLKDDGIALIPIEKIVYISFKE